jgi:hypothetical protein
MVHRLPPPWAAQKFLSRAPLVQPGYVQRRPPPCAMQYLVLPCAHLVQPGACGHKGEGPGEMAGYMDRRRSDRLRK